MAIGKAGDPQAGQGICVPASPPLPLARQGGMEETGAGGMGCMGGVRAVELGGQAWGKGSRTLLEKAARPGSPNFAHAVLYPLGQGVCRDSCSTQPPCQSWSSTLLPACLASAHQACRESCVPAAVKKGYEAWQPGSGRRGARRFQAGVAAAWPRFCSPAGTTGCVGTFKSMHASPPQLGKELSGQGGSDLGSRGRGEAPARLPVGPAG
eukprot:350337-Chlamydomonas_euryale.AAC.2